MSKILILDDSRETDPAEIREALSKKKVDGVVCKTSNEFMTALNNPKFDAAYINAGAWVRGRAIYDYFGAGSKLPKTVVVYDSDEDAVPIRGRAPGTGDAVHRKPFDLKAVIGTL